MVGTNLWQPLLAFTRNHMEIKEEVLDSFHPLPQAPPWYLWSVKNWDMTDTWKHDLGQNKAMGEFCLCRTAGILSLHWTWCPQKPFWFCSSDAWTALPTWAGIDWIYFPVMGIYLSQSIQFASKYFGTFIKLLAFLYMKDSYCTKNWAFIWISIFEELMKELSCLKYLLNNYKKGIL